MIEQEEWQVQAVKLAETGVMSWRDISKQLNVPKSTVSDFLRSYYSFKGGDEEDTQQDNITHLVIPDSQVRPGLDLDYLRWIGEYIVRKKPNVIVHLGDFADFESLSSYDKGKKSAEGKRVQADIEVSILGMQTLLAPLRKLQEAQQKAGEEVYQPRMVLTLGNHEDRLTRHVNEHPHLEGFLNMNSLKYEEFGWEVYPFLTPVEIDGINYCHYFPNVLTGKPLGGSAANMLKTIGGSFTMGHRQVLDIAHRQLPTDGSRQWGIIAGAGYVHDEHYKGVQGNHHWRGIIMKHNVNNGGYDPMFVSMDWLQKEYGK